MGPDPTRAYFWPAVNKRPTQVLFDPTWRDFFWPEGEKLKKLTFLGEIFQIKTQTIDGWPDPTRAAKNWPDKFFDPNPSLVYTYRLKSSIDFSH